MSNRKPHFTKPHRNRIVSEELDCVILTSSTIWLPEAKKYMTAAATEYKNAPQSTNKLFGRVREIYTNAINTMNKNDVAKADHRLYYAYACLVARKFIITKKIDKTYCETIAKRLGITYFEI